VGGERILDRLVRVMTSALGSPPLLVANAPEAPTWRPDLRSVADVRPGLGSLGGIYTAVVEAPAPVDAFLPQSDGRRGVEPLCAAYGPACRDAIARSLDQGDLRAIAFHERIGVGILPLSEVARYGDPEVLFFNVNTADDLARTDELWRRLGSSPSSAGRTPERRR
jgi:molybdopterin-guanine dinucleotide biosynthesis protein A